MSFFSLIEAVSDGDIDQLCELLSSHKQANDEVQAAFLCAVKEEKVDIVRIFMSVGYKPNLNLVCDGEGSFPMFLAMDNFDVDTMKALVSEDMTSDVRSKILRKDSSPLYRAVRWLNDLDMTKVLLQEAHFDINEGINYIQTRNIPYTHYYEKCLLRCFNQYYCSYNSSKCIPHPNP